MHGTTRQSSAWYLECEPALLIDDQQDNGLLARGQIALFSGASVCGSLNIDCQGLNRRSSWILHLPVRASRSDRKNGEKGIFLCTA